MIGELHNTHQMAVALELTSIKAIGWSLTLIVLALVLGPGAQAAVSDDMSDQQLPVMASGVGISEDAALKDAFTNAIQSAVGTVVDAETLVQNDKVMMDQVLTYSNAFIKNFDKTSSEKRADGLYEVRIKAEVQRKQLIEKLKAANIAVRDIDTTSVYAQVVTQNKEEKDAKTLLAKVMQDLDYPGCLLIARIDAEEPKILEKNEKSVKVEWPLVISIDENIYFNKVFPKLKEVLDAIAKQKSDTDTIQNGCHLGGEEPALIDYWCSPLSYGIIPKNTVNLVVKKNTLGDNVRVCSFLLDGEAFTVIHNFLGPRDSSGSNKELRELPMLRIAWLDKDTNPIIEDEVDLNDYPKKEQLDTYPYNGNNGYPHHFGWFYKSNGGFLQLGPFLYLNDPRMRYCSALRCSYKRVLSIDDLKQITKMKCYFVSRVRNVTKP